MRRAVAPRFYTVQLSSLAMMLRTLAVDKRLTETELQRAHMAIDALTEVMQSAQRKVASKQP